MKSRQARPQTSHQLTATGASRDPALLYFRLHDPFHNHPQPTATSQMRLNSQQGTQSNRQHPVLEQHAPSSLNDLLSRGPFYTQPEPAEGSSERQVLSHSHTEGQKAGRGKLRGSGRTRRLASGHFGVAGDHCWRCHPCSCARNGWVSTGEAGEIATAILPPLATLRCCCPFSVPRRAPQQECKCLMHPFPEGPRGLTALAADTQHGGEGASPRGRAQPEGCDPGGGGRDEGASLEDPRLTPTTGQGGREGRRRRSPLRTQSGRPPAAILRATPRSPRLNLQPMSEEAPPRSGHRIAIARHRARPPPPSSADETAPRCRPRRPPGPAAPAGNEPRERWVPGGRGGEDEVGAVPSSAGPPQGVAVRSGKPGPAAAPPSVHVPGGGEGERGARGGEGAGGGGCGQTPLV